MPSFTSRVAEPALNNARSVSPSTPIYRSTSAPAKWSSTPPSFLIPPRITSSQPPRSNATARPTSSLSASSPSPPVRTPAACSPTNQLLLHAMSALTVLVSSNPTGRALVVTVDPSLHQLLSHLTTVTIALNELLALPMAQETGSALMAKMARLAETQITVLSAALTLLSRSRVASSAGVGVGLGSCGATRTCTDQEATNRMAAPAPTLVLAETVPTRAAAPATVPSVARAASVPFVENGLDSRHPLTTPDAARIVSASPADGGSDARQPFTTPIGQLTMLSAASPAHRSPSWSQSRSSTEPGTRSRACSRSTSRSASPTQLPLPSRFSRPTLPSVPVPGPKLEHLKSDPAQGPGNEPSMLLLDVDPTQRSAGADRAHHVSTTANTSRIQPAPTRSGTTRPTTSTAPAASPRTAPTRSSSAIPRSGSTRSSRVISTSIPKPISSSSTQLPSASTVRYPRSKLTPERILPHRSSTINTLPMFPETAAIDCRPSSSLKTPCAPSRQGEACSQRSSMFGGAPPLKSTRVSSRVLPRVSCAAPRSSIGRSAAGGRGVQVVAS